MPEQSLTLPCPACRQTMSPRVLECMACALRVEGHFRSNEFAELEDDFLQLLRVFVLCEGRIRDMEKALGISYPTVKIRLAALRARLGLTGERPGMTPSLDDQNEPVNSSDETTRARQAPGALSVLDALASGEIDQAEAVRRLRGQ